MTRTALVIASTLWCSVSLGQPLTSEQHDTLLMAIKNRSCKAQPEDALNEVRSVNQFMYSLDGAGAVEYLRKHKYLDLTSFDLAMHYCIKLPRPLGRIDTWRYESCQIDAAKAPTPQGVGAGMRVCREKFGQ